MGDSLGRLLGNAALYVAVQKGIGADRIRHRCLEEAALKPGERVLDVGCGPAYYLDRLPAVSYVGFDTSAAYLAHARRRHAGRGDFRRGIVTAERLRELGEFDAVLLFGLLHHLDDPECGTLLDLCASALAPGGRVVSCDPVVHKGQSRVSRWMSEHDRGGYVRAPEAYEHLAAARFGELETSLLDTLSRVPASHYLMRMAGPLVPASCPVETGSPATGS